MTTLFDMVRDVLDDSREKLAEHTPGHVDKCKDCKKAPCVCKDEEEKTASAIEDPEKVAQWCDYLAANIGEIADDRSPHEKLAEYEAIRVQMEKAAADSDPPMTPPTDAAGQNPGSAGSAMKAEETNTPGESLDAGEGGQATSEKVIPTSITPTEKPNANDAANAFATNIDDPPGGTSPYPEKLGGAPMNLAQALLNKFAADENNPASISGGTAPLLQSAAGANPAQMQGTEAGEQVPNEQGSDSGRQLIASNEAAINADKRQAKTPTVKADMGGILAEPAMSAAHDKVLNKSLENASSAGVKIAATRELLTKWAEASPANKHKLAAAMKKHAEGEEGAPPPPEEEGPTPAPEAGAGIPPTGAEPYVPMGEPPVSDEALAAAAEGVTPEELAAAQAMLAAQGAGAEPGLPPEAPPAMAAPPQAAPPPAPAEAPPEAAPPAA